MMNYLKIAFFVLVMPAALLADDIAVTIYNSNLGVISETRSLQFEKGINKLAFRDVPSQIDANSVRFLPDRCQLGQIRHRGLWSQCGHS